MEVIKGPPPSTHITILCLVRLAFEALRGPGADASKIPLVLMTSRYPTLCLRMSLMSPPGFMLRLRNAV